jgi:hypothetical protein
MLQNLRPWLLVPAAAALTAGAAPLTGFSGESPSPTLASAVREHRDEARARGWYRDPAPGILGPGLAAAAVRAPEGSFTVWVFFTDTGIGTEAEYGAAMEAARARLDPHAARRRAALGEAGRLDFTDLPVHEPYVDALRGAGLRVRRTSRWLNAASVTGTGRAVEGLRDLPFVHRVQPVLVKRAALEPGPVDPRTERPVSSTSTQTGCPVPPSDPLEAAFYGGSYDQLDQIRVLDLQRQGYSGAGVRVMVLDTGFKRTHPAFAAASVLAEWDFVNEDAHTANEGADTATQHNHGTGCWGTLGGYARGNLIGPAFGAEFLLAKTEDVTQEVHAEEDNYVAALEWGDGFGVDVTSASLAYFDFDSGYDYTLADLNGDTAVITIAVDLAARKGIVCVNAMGNAGPNPTTLATPADADTVIAVGAADSCGTVTSFSSRGPTSDGRIKPEISARGRRTTWAVAGTDGFGVASGTSLSTPLIGGLAALLREAHPTWTPVQLRAALMGTGSQASTPDNNLGYGIADGWSALAYGGATPAPPRMTLPFTLLVPANQSTVSSGSPSFAWSASVAKQPGDQAVYRLLVDDDPALASPDTFYAGTATSITPALNLPGGAVRYWKVLARNTAGYERESLNVSRFTVGSATRVPDDPVAAAWFLGHPAPNPAVRTAAIPVRVPAGERATLRVHDLSGREVRRFEMSGTGGTEPVRWDGRDAAGREVPAGVYLVRLSGGPSALLAKIILVR